MECLLERGLESFDETILNLIDSELEEHIKQPIESEARTCSMVLAVFRH